MELEVMSRKSDLLVAHLDTHPEAVRAYVAREIAAAVEYGGADDYSAGMEADALAMEREYADIERARRASVVSERAAASRRHTDRVAAIAARRAQLLAVADTVPARMAGAVADVFNRAGAHAVVAVITAERVELDTVTRAGAAPLAIVGNGRAVVSPVAVHTDADGIDAKLEALIVAARIALFIAERADAGRAANAGASKERRESDRAAAAVDKYRARVAGVAVPVADADALAGAIRAHAGARVASRGTGSAYELRMRKAHRARQAVQVSESADTAAAAADMLTSATGERLLESALDAPDGRQVGKLLGRALTPAERKAISRARARVAAAREAVESAAVAPVVVSRGTDTASARMTESLRKRARRA